ncbi:MAG TPA: hypothetical protein VE955_09095 [Candidatus Dormibacteraeota bacterium]|jgi:hypothetical protein|nr:hypothetical protein [Candidatus Dormibacteraeota bacterium]
MEALPYPLNAWAIVDESYSILYSNENWKMANGLKFDENFMKNIAGQKASHAERFLSSSRRPRRLFLKCVSDVSESKKTALNLELDKLRAERIVSKKKRFHGRPVNWKTWRQFNATADAKSRKKVYDELVKKTPIIKPIIRCNVRKVMGCPPEIRNYSSAQLLGR